jgi:MFS family permease
VRGIHAISLSAFAVMVGMGVIAPLLPLFAENLGATGLWIGLIFSAYSLSRLVFLPLAGKLSDVYGRRNILLIGLFLYSVISLLYTISANPAQLSIVRLLHGISSALIIPVAMAAAAETSERGEEGKTLGMFNQAIFLGLAAGPILGGFTSDFFGYKATFVSVSLIGFITLLVAFLTFPEGRIKQREGKIKLSRRILAAFLFRFLNSLGRGSVITFLPIYLGLLNFSASTIGILLSVNLLTSALIQPSSGKLSDRMGAKLPVTFSAVLSAAILLVIPRISEITVLFGLSVLFGISSALAIPGIAAIVAVEGRGGNMAQLMGTLSAAKSMGRIAGPIISGAIFDVSGGGIEGILAAFSVAAVLSILSLLTFLILEGKEKKFYFEMETL